MPPIYLDYNATTPIHPAAVDAMRPCLEGQFGNPSSAHPYGRVARQAVHAARCQVAALLGCRPEEVTFTSGGTESNNLALIGVARALADRGRHLVTSAVEHPAIVQVLAFLRDEGWRVTVVPVDETGRLSPADVEAALEPDTLMPLAEIAPRLRARGILFHTDAAQSVGKVPTKVDELGVDLLTVAGHKLYAPKGIGALYVRAGTPLRRVQHGAGQERGLRAGTENVPYIVGLGEACRLAAADLPGRMAHMQGLRDRLHRGLEAALPPGTTRLNGHAEHRLPNTLNIGFRGIDATRLLDAIQEEVAASAGAACHSAGEDSSVLGAMRVPAEYRNGTVRLSTGLFLTEAEVDRAVAVLAAAVRSQQNG
jgi:cysteine desulfurase